MRELSDDQRVAWAGLGSKVWAQVRIADGDGILHNWTDLFGLNFVESVDYGETQDQPGQDATITLIWRRYHDNASPWVVAGQRLEGFLGVGHRVLIDVAILPEGPEPQSGDWVTVFDGQIDSFRLGYPTAQIECRDRIIAQLTDRWIEADTKYGTVAGRAMESVMADILDDWGGSPAQPLWTPSSPGYAITAYNQQAEPVLSALTTLALLTGWDLRPRWRQSAAAFQLALTEPDRAGAAPVFTLPLSMIQGMGEVGVALDDIRNVVRVFYTDGELSAGGQLVIKQVVRVNDASRLKYGRRFFELTEGSSSAINTLTEATALADAILADLSEPDVSATITIPLEWWLELGDTITVPADGERFGAAQVLAVVGLRRHILEGEAVSTIQLYGKPRTGRRNWLEREGRAGVAPAVSQIKPALQLPPRSQVKIGGTLITADWPSTSGFEAIEFHKGASADFVPDELTLVQFGKGRSLYVGDDPNALAYYKTIVVDRYGNRSDPSEAASGIAGYVPAPALAPAVRAVVQVRRITSAQTISASGPQVVQLQQEDIDPAGVWTAASYWLVPLNNGIYRFDLDLRVSFDAASTYEITIADGGGAVWTSGTRAAVTERYQVTTLLELAEGVKYVVQLERNSGSADVGVGSQLIIEPTLALAQDTVPTLAAAPAITGDLSVGDLLTCSSGTWSAAPSATYAYRWLRDAVAIVGATASTYTLVAADAGLMITCVVVATNRAGVATALADRVGPIEPAAAAPTNDLAPELTGLLFVSAELSCSNGVWSGYPAPTFTRQWRRDTADIGGATLPTYTLVSADIGATIDCAVYANNLAGGSTAYSNAEGPVAAAAAAPINMAAPVISGTPTDGELLSCTPGTWTGYPTPTFTYQWRRTAGLGFAAIVGATSATYTLTAAEIGEEVSCVVTATNASGDAGQASNALGPVADIAPTAPVNTVAPVVSGTPTEGETLSVTDGTWTGTLPITYTYQWVWDEGGYYEPIVGATSATYTLEASDVGHLVACVVTATNAHSAVDAYSNSVGSIAPSGIAPVNTVAPVASGTVRIGQTLTSTPGTWTGTPTPTYAYQWRRDGVDIGGATASTYVVVAADMACEIDCVVTASNGVSPDADEVSNVLASPWQAILAARPGVLIWDALDPYCYGGAAVSAPVADLYTVDGVALATQATTAKRATRTATDLDFDGADDGYVGTPTLAPYWQADQTYVVGADGLSGAAGEVALHANGGPSSPYRQALIAGSTNAARNVHRTNDAGASMLGLPTASQDLAVTWTTGAPGAGELFDLASGVTSVRSVAPASLPSHTYTQWTLGGDIALSSTWQGNLRHLAIDDSVWSAGDLALYRSCAIAAGVM